MVRLLMAAVGICCLLQVARSLWIGEAPIFSKPPGLTVRWSDGPIWFFATLALWATGGVVMLWGAVADRDKH